MLPGSLIQTKVRLNLKNKVASSAAGSSAAGSLAAGSASAGTAAAGSASAGTAAAGTAVAVSTVAVSAPAESAAPVSVESAASVSVASSDHADMVPVARAVDAKSACTVPPPPCASGYHSDSNGDCVSDVSVPAIVSDGK
jgi:hypothetical protein